MRIEGFYPMGYTSVPHSFIDQYMAPANGEFVKTYLLLLRLSEGGDFSVSQLADKLEQTEGDVRRALKYWASKGLLRLVEKGGEVESVSVLFPRGEGLEGLFHSVTDKSAPAEKESTPGAKAAASPQEEAREAPKAPAVPGELPSRSYTADQLKALKEQQDFDQLLFALEHYLGRTLSDRDVDMMAYLYDELGFPGEVLEYLAEYCVERFEREEKKKDYQLMRYMEVVALNWHSRGAVTLEQAKLQTQLFARDSAVYIAVGKALGLKNRQLTENECRRVNAWMEELRMPRELIVEACERTIASRNQPNFNYTESILKSWQKEGIDSLVRLKEADERRQREGAAPRKEGEREKGHYQSALQDVDYAKLLQKKDKK